jgi:hypothetical protein
LYKNEDERITKYDKDLLIKMLANRSYHSPELSDTDEENREKSVVNVYDLSWRSSEV